MLLLAGQKDKYENRLILASDKDKLFEAEHNLSKFVFIRKNIFFGISKTGNSRWVIILSAKVFFFKIEKISQTSVEKNVV